MTLEKNSGHILWERQIGSPVVALYKLIGDGIASVPFTSVSRETLGNLLEQETVTTEVAVKKLL